jgi:hypothetical protein
LISLLWFLPVFGAQGVVGNIASVALGPDGTVWVLSRGGRVWDKNSFDAGDHLTAKGPIDSNVVMQLHPDTGARTHIAHGHEPAVCALGPHSSVSNAYPALLQ